MTPDPGAGTELPTMAASAPVRDDAGEAHGPAPEGGRAVSLPLRLWRRTGWWGVVVLLVLALALALRLNGLSWGLPYNFINPDEGTIVPKAFHIAQGHPNPQFFYYPTLYFYLLAALYWLATPVLWLLGHGNLLASSSFIVDQGPYFLLGRLLSVGFGVAGVYLLYLLGREVAGRAAGLLAAVFLAVEPLHVKYSHVAVTDVTATTFALLALYLLLRAAKGGGRRWLVAGAVAAGLATSTKYNLGMLVLPAVIAACYASSDEARRRVAAGARAVTLWPRLIVTRVFVPMLVAFVAASPFVVLDARHFAHDFLRQGAIMRTGWLGFENTGNGFWYNIQVNLAGALGIVLLALSLAGLALALWRRTRFDLLVAPYIIIYFAYVSTWKELADRYLLPVVPLLLLLAARLCVELFRARPVARWALATSLAALIAAALVLPLGDSIAFNRQLSGPDVRVRAKTWVERNIKAGSVIASDSYGPPLVRRRDAKYYRAEGLTPVPYRLFKLKLPVPGEPARRYSLSWLRERHVRYVIVTSAVYDRIFAAADRYPELAAFYERLDTRAELVRVFRPRRGEHGPVIRLYRLTTVHPAKGRG